MNVTYPSALSMPPMGAVCWTEMVSHRSYLVRFAQRKLHDPVLAEDLVSVLHVPPQDNSSMDGYAVRVADVTEKGVVLAVMAHLIWGGMAVYFGLIRHISPIEIAVNRDGDVYWGMQRLRDNDELFKRLSEVAVRQPQPEVHIRGDLAGRYEHVGRVVFAAQRAGIQKVGFVTEPPSSPGTR